MRAISQAALIAMALLLWHPTAAHAQTLKGLKRIAITGILQSVTDDHCGITEQDLETAAGFIVQQSRLQIVADSAGGLLEAKVNLFAEPSDLCVLAMEVEFVTRVVGTSPYGHYDGPAGTWSLSIVATAGRSSARKTATDFVERATKQFVVQWSKENP